MLSWKTMSSGSIPVLMTLVLFTVVNAQTARPTEISIDEQAYSDSLPVLLSKLAYKYRTPIGLEVAENDSISKTIMITAKSPQFTLESLLNEIVRIKPNYRWDVQDGVVNVFPMESSRDGLIRTLLTTRIDSLSVSKSEGSFTFRQSVMDLPEVQVLMKANNVNNGNEFFAGTDLTSLGKDFSPTFSSVPLKIILNRTIRESTSKFWIVSRFGKNREYLLINL